MMPPDRICSRASVLVCVRVMECVRVCTSGGVFQFVSGKLRAELRWDDRRH